MAQKSEQRAAGAELAARPHGIWWKVPAVIGGCLAGIVFAYLHFRMGGFSQTHALAVAAANLAIFLVTYSIFRRIRTHHSENSLVGMLISLLIAIPVFVIAFFGLGYEIPEMADFGAMYVLGVWIGSAESAEMAEEEE